VKAQLVAEHPHAQLGIPEDIAHATLFLVADETSWITGFVVDVAGGAVMAR
jgi:3-oxoacyl-[acyl-carrier protein] reductase